jgi:hypothetical protein
MQCLGKPLSDGDERQPCSGLTRLKHAVKRIAKRESTRHIAYNMGTRTNKQKAM